MYIYVCVHLQLIFHLLHLATVLLFSPCTTEISQSHFIQFMAPSDPKRKSVSQSALPHAFVPLLLRSFDSLCGRSSFPVAPTVFFKCPPRSFSPRINVSKVVLHKATKHSERHHLVMLRRAQRGWETLLLSHTHAHTHQQPSCLCCVCVEAAAGATAASGRSPRLKIRPLILQPQPSSAGALAVRVCAHTPGCSVPAFRSSHPFPCFLIAFHGV